MEEIIIFQATVIKFGDLLGVCKLAKLCLLGQKPQGYGVRL